MTKIINIIKTILKQITQNYIKNMQNPIKNMYIEGIENGQYKLSERAKYLEEKLGMEYLKTIDKNIERYCVDSKKRGEMENIEEIHYCIEYMNLLGYETYSFYGTTLGILWEYPKECKIINSVVMNAHNALILSSKIEIIENEIIKIKGEISIKIVNELKNGKYCVEHDLKYLSEMHCIHDICSILNKLYQDGGYDIAYDNYVIAISWENPKCDDTMACVYKKISDTHNALSKKKN